MLADWVTGIIAFPLLIEIWAVREAPGRVDLRSDLQRTGAVARIFADDFEPRRSAGSRRPRAARRRIDVEVRFALDGGQAHTSRRDRIRTHDDRLGNDAVGSQIIAVRSTALEKILA